MSSSALLADLLDQASNVFGLASMLARDFQQEFQSRGPVSLAGQDSPRVTHGEHINEFITAILNLRDEIQNPPDGFTKVAEQLRQAGEYAKAIRNLPNLDILELWPELNGVARDGLEAVKEARDTCRLDDPFAFVDGPTISQSSHLAFLEKVRDEVHYSAEMKRQQLAREYSNEVLANSVDGIKWPEVKQRVAMLADLPADLVETVASVLRRQLTVGTIERVDELLTPAVRELRDAWENRDSLEIQGTGGKLSELVAGSPSQAKQEQPTEADTPSAGDDLATLEAKTPANSSESPWMTFADAERITGINRGTINRAADKGSILTNDENGNARRIDRASFTVWATKRAKTPEQKENDATVKRLLREQGLG